SANLVRSADGQCFGGRRSIRVAVTHHKSAFNRINDDWPQARFGKRGLIWLWSRPFWFLLVMQPAFLIFRWRGDRKKIGKKPAVFLFVLFAEDIHDFMHASADKT